MEERRSRGDIEPEGELIKYGVVREYERTSRAVMRFRGS